MLEELYRRVWEGIRRGASPARAPFTMWQLATIGLEGRPQLRSLVLRGAEEGARTLSFHTDRRSAKLRELQSNPDVALASLDLDSHTQLRINGAASLCTDHAEMESMWRAARPHTLILYQNPLPPGTTINHPEEGWPKASGAADGFEHFALVHVQVSAIEYLDISPGNHRRAVFNLSEGKVESRWIAP